MLQVAITLMGFSENNILSTVLVGVYLTKKPHFQKIKKTLTF